ncbi:BamA/TamA family outer membrane protein [Flavobacterium sp. WC2509]|uniref:BamA/TamA family outer membrane protein n=1 Tax=Flavobacterium sp. WC2509 TaxID=3461406 RepID=UPI004043DF8D
MRNNNTINKLAIISAISFLLLFCQFSFAQSDNDSLKCPIKSLPEFFRKKDSLFVVKPLKNDFLLVLPVLSVQPANGFIYGAISQYTFKDKQPDDKYSTAYLMATYTTKKQLLIDVKNNLILHHNKIYMGGDWRYYKFSQSNYGLGSDIIPSDEPDFSISSIAQPMKYDYFKFHQTASILVADDLFVGGGIHFDGYMNIFDQTLDVANNQLTYHYVYNTSHGFSTNKYFVKGISANVIYDSRDNLVNPNNGLFANVNYKTNLGIEKNGSPSSVLFTELKYYIPLSKTNKQHVLAFWSYAQFLTKGNLPYLNLPAIGGDQQSRSGKGYTQGLLRGQDLCYFETEYRFPITCNQLLSGTVFANFTSTSDRDRDIQVLQFIQPAFGIGLRLLIDKATKTNVMASYGWGRHSQSFYINTGESF